DRPRDPHAVVYRAEDLECFLSERSCGQVVGLTQCERRTGIQHIRTLAGLQIGGRVEYLAEPTPTFGQVPGAVPEPAQRRDEPECPTDVAMVDREAQSASQIVVFLLEPLEPVRLTLPEHLRPGLFDESEEKFRVAASYLLVLAHLLQALTRVGLDRLQHGEARLTVHPVPTDQ